MLEATSLMSGLHGSRQPAGAVHALLLDQQRDARLAADIAAAATDGGPLDVSPFIVVPGLVALLSVELWKWVLRRSSAVGSRIALVLWLSLTGSDLPRATAATAAGVDLQRSAANAALLRDFYAAFLKGDAKRVASLVTRDFILHVPGKGVHAGDYRGPEGVQKALATVLACNGGTLDVRVPVLSVNGDDAFTREWVRINRNDEPGWKDWDLAVSRHYRMKAGRVSEIWVLPEDQRLYDDYWSAPCRPGGGGGATSVTRPPLEIEGATSPENLRLITTASERFLQGDTEGLQRVIDPGVIVNIAGRSALSGTYGGWDGFVKFRERLMGTVGSRYKFEVATLAASERDAWVEESIRMDRPSDARLETIHVVVHFSIQDGRITGIDEFPLDTYAWERFLDSVPLRQLPRRYPKAIEGLYEPLGIAAKLSI